jgi:hypothetical protein
MEDDDEGSDDGVESQQPEQAVGTDEQRGPITEGDVGGEAKKAVTAEAQTEFAGEAQPVGTEADENSSDEDDGSSEGDDASVVDEKVVVEEEPADPLEILIYPIPVQPEVTIKHTPQQVEVDEEEYSDNDDVPAVSPSCLL